MKGERKKKRKRKGRSSRKRIRDGWKKKRSSRKTQAEASPKAGEG